MINKSIITEPILIVDDDADDQFLLRRIFERIGMFSELIFYSNAKDALQFLKSTKKNIFLILCDINMPGINGLEFRSMITSDEPLRKKNIPFVFLSTSASPSDVSNAFELTVQGFFQKESSYEAMEEAIRCIVTYWMKCKCPGAR